MSNDHAQDCLGKEFASAWPADATYYKGDAIHESMRVDCTPDVTRCLPKLYLTFRIATLTHVVTTDIFACIKSVSIENEGINLLEIVVEDESLSLTST